MKPIAPEDALPPHIEYDPDPVIIEQQPPILSKNAKKNKVKTFVR